MQKKLSILALLLMILACLGLVALHAILSPSPVVIVLQACGIALMVWARLTFGMRSFHAAASPTGGGLITRGPYRHVRHPIYTAIFLCVWPGAIANGSSAAIALAVLLACGIVVRMLCEESLLVRAYPEYREYAMTTKRMIPYVF